MTKAVKVRVGEVTIDGAIVAYKIVASGNLEAHDLLVRHLGPKTKWKRIKVRSTPESLAGPARVVGKIPN
jgi:hypothetical protein